MSVVYLKNRSTPDAGSFDNFKFVDNNLLQEVPYTVEDFEVPLTAGEWASDASKKRRHFQTISDDGIDIKQNSSITIEVNELIHVSYNMFEIVFLKGDLLHVCGYDVFCVAAKIDPSFEGRLRICVFNSSASLFKLRWDDIIASAVFFPDLCYVKPESSYLVATKIIKGKRLRRRIYDFLIQNWHFLFNVV